MSLMKLGPDFLFKVLREYLSFEDKLDRLLPILEFRPYLAHRSAWITSCPYVSLPFLDWLRTLTRGWYVHRDNWSHRLLLGRDPRRMTLSLHHFLLDYGLPLSPVPTSTHPFESPWEGMPDLLEAFLEDYVFLPHLPLSLYTLKPYGLIMVQYDYPDRDHCKMRFYNWEEYIFSYYQPTRMKDAAGVDHFKVLLTDDHTLRVECLLKAQGCLCDQRTTELHPVSWDVDETGQYLKTSEGSLVSVAGVETFGMKNRQTLQGTMTYFTPSPYPDMQVEVRGVYNQRLKQQLFS